MLKRHWCHSWSRCCQTLRGHCYSVASRLCVSKRSGNCLGVKPAPQDGGCCNSVGRCCTSHWRMCCAREACKRQLGRTDVAQSHKRCYIVYCHDLEGYCPTRNDRGR